MISAVDTNVLLDILIPNAQFADRSLSCVATAAQKGPMIISEIVYAELSSQFLNREDVAQFLTETMIQLVVSDEKALWEAGRVWIGYTGKRTSGDVCPSCGKKRPPYCFHCRYPLPSKRHIISDFLIGAHAKTFAGCLITRDRGFYRRYFKYLPIIDPSRTH
jgi:hypothetical protein